MERWGILTNPRNTGMEGAQDKVRGSALALLLPGGCLGWAMRTAASA